MQGVTIKLLLFCVLLSSTTIFVHSQNDYYQSIWSVKKDYVEFNSNKILRHRMGLKNFISTNERSYFRDSDITNRESSPSSFIIRADRQWVSGAETFAYGASYNDLAKQASHYFPTIQLKSQDTQYYVIEDLDRAANVLYCESRFYISYFRNFKLARLYYENLVSSAPASYYAFGGKNGLIASNNLDYFIEKYMSYWCEYRFGLFANVPRVTSNPFSDETTHVLVAATDGELDFAVGDNSAAAGYPECHFTEETDDEVIFVPTDFDVHCQKTTSASSVPHTYCLNAASVSVKSYLYQAVDTNKYCKKGGRGFMRWKLFSSNNDFAGITADINCTRGGAGSVSMSGISIVPVTGATNWSDYYNAYATKFQVVSGQTTNCLSTVGEDCETNVDFYTVTSCSATVTASPQPWVKIPSSEISFTNSKTVGATSIDFSLDVSVQIEILQTP
mmetsp:Transcript_24228/g.25280  ORF Transcript_24228/g.25280 Transcript_24228/m.25280 type:complete len:446 (+) Transcript_24228:17-1354(+)